MALNHVLTPNTVDNTSQTDLWFDHIFDETKEQVLRYIYIHTYDISSVDDIFQEVYTSLYRRIRRKGAADIDEPAAFLTKAAKREIVRHNRRSKQRKTVSIEENCVALPNLARSVEDAAADRDVLRAIQQTVLSMPTLTSKAFILFYYFDMPIASIAKELAISIDAVKSRLNRARREVRANVRLEVNDEG